MMSRKKIAAANWKMHLTIEEGRELLSRIKDDLPSPLHCEVIVSPPLTHLYALGQRLKDGPIALSAQHCHYAASGAFTGEVSVEMIKSAGATHCITGHSERRQLFQEDNEMIKRKVNAILDADLIPIFCCGEPLDIREANDQNNFVFRQLEESLFHLSGGLFEKVIIAYEPIWAIGTGVIASPQQAQEMHAFIRETIATQYGITTAEQTRILYGGSIKGDNADTLFAQPDVDGGLIGGASLKAAEFLTIIQAANH